MKKNILIIIYIILILITVKLLFNYVTNSILVNQYNNGNYDETYAKTLTKFNLFPSYIANYNYGNILFKNGDYETAIEQYKKALEGMVPKYKECSIRINYALSICKTVQLDESDKDSIKSAIDKYESAINILTEKNCANKENNNGHSQKAEQLKQDIEKEIERLKNLLKEENNSDKDENNDNEEKDETETIEDKIQQIKEEALEEQREKEDKYKNYNKTFNNTNKNW